MIAAVDWEHVIDAPSMRRQIDLAKQYERARVGVAGLLPAATLPISCPVSLDDLLDGPPDVATLERRFVEAAP